MSSEVRLARLRTRWSAIGAAVAITLGAGGVGLASASIGTGEKPVTITIEPERILDTRVNLGLAGSFSSDTPRDLQVTGSVPVASGGNKIVVPAGASAVIVNVTAVNPSADGFLSLRPKGAAGSPSTSTVNFGPGGVEPNSATVDLSADGGIQIWAFLLGGATSVDVLVDVVGYTIDHHHDDRYYTQTEVDAKFSSTVDLQVGIAGAAADNGTVNWTNGCVRQDAAPNTVRLGIDLPIGATITDLTGYLIGNGAVLDLRRTTGGQTSLVTVTNPSAGLQEVSASLATPEAVNSGEFFYLEFRGAAGSSQLCGAAVRYTVAPGTSLQGVDAQPDGVSGSPTGQ